MKRQYFLSVPALVAVLLLNLEGAEARTVDVNAQASNPIVVEGSSGGSQSGSCGFVSPSPNLVVRVTEPTPYLRVSVEAGGQPTLLVQRPGQKPFCILKQGDRLETSGFWEAGEYNLFVGDRQSAQGSSYRVTISR